MNSTAAIFARLTGDATLTDLLKEWRGEPAVFSDRAPDALFIGDDGQPAPLGGIILIIASPADDRPVETFTERARDITRDVRGYAPDTGSSLALDTVMERVRVLFHNQPSALTVTGGTVQIARVTGPVASLTTDPALIGRRVTLRLEIEEA